MISLDSAYTLPSFETEHYVIRALTEADAPAIFARFIDPDMTRY